MTEKIDVEMPGAPTGPTTEVWPLKDVFWKQDGKDPWPGDPNSQTGGGRMSVPPGGDQDPDNYGETI